MLLLDCGSRCLCLGCKSDCLGLSCQWAIFLPVLQVFVWGHSSSPWSCFESLFGLSWTGFVFAFSEYHWCLGRRKGCWRCSSSIQFAVVVFTLVPNRFILELLQQYPDQDHFAILFCQDLCSIGTISPHIPVLISSKFGSSCHLMKGCSSLYSLPILIRNQDQLSCNYSLPSARPSWWGQMPC